MTVIIFGASGLIGLEILKSLIVENSSQVIAVVPSRDVLLGQLESLELGDLSVFEMKSCDPEQVWRLFRLLKSEISEENKIGIINLARNLKALNAEKISEYLSTEIDFSYSIVDAAVSIFGLRVSRVILCSSIYGRRVPNPGLYEDGLNRSPIHYGIAKAGIEKLVQELAVRNSRRGLTINAIAFGGVKGRVNIKFEEKYQSLSTFAEMLSVSDCVGPINFLLSKSSSAITGQTLVVDKGYTLV